MAAPARIEVRNIHFAIDGEIPHAWHGGRRAVTAYFDNLSIFFPPGERFFVASVKAHRDCVTDPELAAAVRAFCAQEGAHSREHVRYNGMQTAHGRPAAAMEERVVRLLRRVSRRTPKRWQLAVTCALEHFTALMARLLLGNRALLEGAHPVMATMWLWHAAEENEHKSVAFDVYRAAGGRWSERCLVMLGATAIFWAKVFEHQVRLMHADGILWSPREWGSLIRFLFLRRRGMLSLIPAYLSYFRPGFHPSQLDDTELLAEWREELATSPDYQAARDYLSAS